ncbi:hypothetical protein BGZ94_007634 [Podila epigama]|nr:hypothetical protein BGZ94_007634 [Podila epigama]
MLRQITRVISRPQASTSLRLFTSATERSINEPSVNYRPGKEGFAPGIPHPKGTSPAPKPTPPPRTVDSLPQMSAKHTRKTVTSPEQKYKLEMTKLRHTYQREHFESEDAKRAETERQRGGALRRIQALQNKDRIENEQRLAFEKLMKPADQAASGPERQAKVAEFVRNRKIKRQQNYNLAQEQASEQRLDAMIRLYHAAEDFVTMENLDAKVNEFYETSLTLQRKVFDPSVSEMVSDVMENGGQISHAQLLKREQELKDALDGTVAGGKISYEGAKALSQSA